MKIMFVIKALNNVKGGAERVLVDVASGLADMGHNVVILSFDQAGEQSFYKLSDKVKRLCLDIGDVGSKATVGEVLRRSIAIRKVAQKIKPDAVVAFMHSSFVPASFGMIGTGIPVLASEHIVPDHYKSRKLEYVLFILSSFFAKKITVLSQTILQDYSRILHSKMVVMENPVHPARLLAMPVGGKKEKRIILNVGRLTDQKDQETLIKAFALLADDYPNWSVRIVGEGELLGKLNKIVQSHGLGERIELTGATADIENEYQSSHIFALPSLYESFGLATAEAMAHGLPVLGFKSCPGTNELIINNKNGLLVDGQNRTEIFSQGIRKLISNDTLRERLGACGPESMKRFHPEGIVEKWVIFISEAITNR